MEILGRSMVGVAIESLSLSMGTPTASQLARIQNYRPATLPPYTAEELFTVTIPVFDNLLRTDHMASHQPNMLQNFSDTLPGKPLGFDHYKLGGGRFYGARLTVDLKPTRKNLGEHGLAKENRAVVKEHGGFLQVWGDAFMPADSQLARDFRYGLAAEVSMGTRMVRGAVDRCPDCTCEHPRGIWSSDCDFLHPIYPWAKWYASSPEEYKAISARVAPYVRRIADVWAATEVSIVFQPALPTAKIPTHGEMK